MEQFLVEEAVLMRYQDELRADDERAAEEHQRQEALERARADAHEKAEQGLAAAREARARGDL